MACLDGPIYKEYPEVAYSFSLLPVDQWPEALLSQWRAVDNHRGTVLLRGTVEILSEVCRSGQRWAGGE